MKMMGQLWHEESSDDFDMQLIGSFLKFASQGDRVGLNQMLRKSISPNVQDYDKRTALHLAASEGHAPIVELLLLYKADVNLQDRWGRTPLTDARSYGHRDICRILEVNGGVDFKNDQPMTVRHESDLNDVNIDIAELDLLQSSVVEQGEFGNSEKVKWRGTWVVKTKIKSHVCHPTKMKLSAKDNTRLRELRHPNILQFLGSILHGEEMILITEYLPKGNLEDIVKGKVRLELPTALQYALDIARGMNYLHQHKPLPIVHNHLHPRNLLQDDGGHLKIGEYWLEMLHEQMQPNQETDPRRDGSGHTRNPSGDTKNDIVSFGIIIYQMFEGRQPPIRENSDATYVESADFKANFEMSKCPKRIQQLIEDCIAMDPNKKTDFTAVIQVLEEVSSSLTRPACVC